MKPNLSISIGKLKLKNPVMVASGTFGYAKEFTPYLNLKKLGAIVTKTVTCKPRQGNPAPRTCETPAGLLNAIGLENPGIEAFIKDKIPFLKKLGVPVVMSIASEKNVQEFVELITRVNPLQAVAAIEINISCPNVREHSGQLSSCNLIAQDPQATYEVVKVCRKVTSKPLIVKLSPNVMHIADIACAAEDAGADAVSLINTISGLAIDVESRKSKIKAGTAGLSGPAVRPIAVRMVWETYQKIKLPVIGMGGIMDASSALEFMIAGAHAVCVGTANFINPGVCSDILIGLEEYCLRHKIKNIQNIVGSLHG